ncbi:MAG TPA: PKD domain-containing protein [Verrucomicrobiae bacterium]|nr:PKD domain-containing protein [Verrucomicrobiae bacterium]
MGRFRETFGRVRQQSMPQFWTCLRGGYPSGSLAYFLLKVVLVKLGIFNSSKCGRFLAFLLAAISFSNAMGADVFPVARRGALPGNLWTSAGVSGGRPQVTTIYTNLGIGVSLAQVNSAIASCPSNQVVKFAAGTYNFGGGQINLTKNGVVLRGTTNSAGQPTTFLVNVVLQTSPYWYPAGPNGGWPVKSVRSVASGYTEGSTSITLAAAPNADFAVGDVFMMDQTDDGTLVKPDTQGGETFLRAGRAYCQALQITGINGNTISFQPPLLGTYWAAARSPEAVAWSSVLGRSAQRVGLEDVDIVKGSGNSIYTVRMGPSVNCWVRNVRMNVDTAAAIRMSYSVNSEITHSVFRDTSGTGSGTYATLPAVVTSCKIEDNIFTNLSLAMPCISAVGCSFSYNYGVGPYPYTQQSWFAEYMFPHGGHTHHTIYEGNWLDGPIYFDVVFNNNNSDNGIVRNRIRGWAATKTANCVPITLESAMANTTIIGNLLGENSFHSTYSQMYNIDSSCVGTTRRYNYNTVNDAVNAAEALGVDTIRDSYCYNSRPAWFGDRPWPPFDPTRFAVAAATSLPAGYRSVFGTEPPSSGTPTAVADGNPKLGVAPLNVIFSSAGSVDPEGTALTYSWTFGDGASSTAANPSHTYSADGAYTAFLTVSDGVNTARSGDIIIRVGNQPPIVAASATPREGQPPLDVTFSSTGTSDPEGAALTYSWVFGDGTTSTQPNPIHTYSAYGNYTARLTVSDGRVAVNSTDIIISVNSGLVAAYGFEEATGSATIDSSGNNNTGALINGPIRTDLGKFGKALEFNGQNSYVNVLNSDSLNVTAALTLMCWCYPTVITNSYRNLVYKPEDIYFIEGFTPAPNTPRFYGTFSGANLNAASTLPVNQWTHVAGTYDGAVMRIYINGVEAANRAQTGPIRTSTYDLGIGGNSLNGQYFPGRIDEVRIYNRALTASEIVADMNRPVTGSARPATPEDFQFDIQSQ